jgi:predicted  nucleic acid-binding Zn-ribbon protein
MEYLPIVLTCVGLLAAAVGIWVKHNNEVTAIKTKIEMLELELKEHKRDSSVTNDKLWSEMSAVRREIHEMSKVLAIIANKLDVH